MQVRIAPGIACLKGRCDVVIGQPQGSGPAREVAWSVPYAGAQFGLVVPRDARGIGSLADLRGKRVGIVTGTVALSENDYTVVRFKSREELLDGFASANLDAAFVDADFAAWYLHDHPQLGLRLVAEYVPRERWNMALAVRANDAQLLIEINRALAQLAESGEMRTDLRRRRECRFIPRFEPSDRPRAASNTWHRIRDRGELVVSIDPANLPYSQRQGRSTRVRRRAREGAGRAASGQAPTRLARRPPRDGGGQLLEGRCDLVFGEAVAANAVADDEELAGKVLYSRPYYGTGYVLVRRKNGPHVQSLAELKGVKSERLGTEAGSVADYSLRQRGYLRRLYRNQLAALKALNDGDIDYAYLWANVGWTLHASPDLNVELVPNDVPEDHWNIAVAMGPGDDELKRQVDAALDALIADGTVARALARYHMPYRSGSRAGRRRSGKCRRRSGTRWLTGARSRRCKRSKHQSKRYSGLARIRSAGELVVGLDQNNLPFSTAHPEPAGLDYEIAGLLAKELGVRLRVYWAIPRTIPIPQSCRRGLCDVILGVMPDDRFAQRVLYSRPYYVAKYQLVVRRRRRSLPTAGDPLGVEEGVARPRAKGRAVQTFPSTEAILEAVATGRVRAGYVISTRAPWLAHERWRGQARFPAAPPNPWTVFRSARRCASRTATSRTRSTGPGTSWIDRASLAEVFARWHVPYERVASPDPSKETGS